MDNIQGVLLAFLGFTIFSSGIVLTKAGSPWLKWQGKKTGIYRRYLTLWLIGFALYNLALIPNGMASRTIPPYIVSAISGWGIIVIIILSHFLLKEKIFISDFVYSAMIVAGIVTLNLAQKPVPSEQVDQAAFYIFLVLPFLLFIPAVFRKTSGKPRAVLFASFSGCISGFSLVIMNVVVKQSGFDILSYFNTPYPYLFVSSGTVAFIALQMAMRWGDMMLVGPLQNSLTIIYPVICSYFIFQSRLSAIQIGAIVVIVYSCISIMKKH